MVLKEDIRVTSITLAPVNRMDEFRLKEMTLASKEHWGYPAAMLSEWGSLLRFPPEYLDRCEAYYARVDGRTAGFYAMRRDLPVAVLDHLWVLPEFIGTGLGARLFRHAVERATALGFAELHLEADRNAVGFYAHMGARQVSTVQTRLEGTLPIMALSLLPATLPESPQSSSS